MEVAMRQMSAETQIRDDAIRPVLEKLRAEHSDYEIDTGLADLWEFRTHYGSLTTKLAPGSALITVFAADETCLAHMKMTVASHLAEYLGNTRGLRWQGDGRDEGRPVFFREIAVVSARQISPHLRRSRFRGENLQRFNHGGRSAYAPAAAACRTRARPRWIDPMAKGRRCAHYWDWRWR
jgi:hypothetical protein